MQLHLKIALIVGSLAIATAPAIAIAAQPDEPGNGHGQAKGPDYTPGHPETEPPGPKAGLPEKAKAYGRYCQGESKKHVKGEKGTPFSRCVVAAAKLRSQQS